MIRSECGTSQPTLASMAGMMKMNCDRSKVVNHSIANRRATYLLVSPGHLYTFVYKALEETLDTVQVDVTTRDHLESSNKSIQTCQSINRLPTSE